MYSLVNAFAFTLANTCSTTVHEADQGRAQITLWSAVRQHDSRDMNELKEYKYMVWSVDQEKWIARRLLPPRADVCQWVWSKLGKQRTVLVRTDHCRILQGRIAKEMNEFIWKLWCDRVHLQKNIDSMNLVCSLEDNVVPQSWRIDARRDVSGGGTRWLYI